MPADLAKQLTVSTNISIFQTTLQSDHANDGKFCLHTAGHYSIWGDPGGDVFVSPSEPVFWLHHGQVDRHWWMWQNQDPANRVQQYEGGTNWMDPVNSPRGHITDIQTVHEAAPEGYEAGVPSSQLVSTTSGPFCYVYE
jgi:tyrosinase